MVVAGVDIGGEIGKTALFVVVVEVDEVRKSSEAEVANVSALVHGFCIADEATGAIQSEKIHPSPSLHLSLSTTNPQDFQRRVE